jgi:hypothetical protein
LAAARALLARFAARSGGIRVLVADYVQRRTTALAKEPLVSRGEFLYVRDPACVMFRATSPRVSIVRLAGSTYEVYRPQQQQLERFHLDGPELAQGLFAAVGGDWARLQADFDVVRCGPDPALAERTQVLLAPRLGPVRERLRELAITLWTKDATLFAVAYRDSAGDLIEIELRTLRENPKDPPSASLAVPKEAKIIEHAAKVRR